MSLTEFAPIIGGGVAVAIALGAVVWKVVKTLLDQRFKIQEQKADTRFKIITERLEGFKSALDRLTDRFDRFAPPTEGDD